MDKNWGWRGWFWSKSSKTITCSSSLNSWSILKAYQKCFVHCLHGFPSQSINPTMGESGHHGRDGSFLLLFYGYFRSDKAELWLVFWAQELSSNVFSSIAQSVQNRELDMIQWNDSIARDNEFCNMTRTIPGGLQMMLVGQWLISQATVVKIKWKWERKTLRVVRRTCGKGWAPDLGRLWRWRSGI